MKDLDPDKRMRFSKEVVRMAVGHGLDEDRLMWLVYSISCISSSNEKMFGLFRMVNTGLMAELMSADSSNQENAETN